MLTLLCRRPVGDSLLATPCSQAQADPVCRIATETRPIRTPTAVHRIMPYGSILVPGQRGPNGLPCHDCPGRDLDNVVKALRDSQMESVAFLRRSHRRRMSRETGTILV